MSRSDDTRVALISGASRGIGAAIVRRLSRSGWALSLGMRSPALPQGIEAGRTQLVVHDALQADEAAWAEAALDRFGRIDAVVCSAGIMTPATVIDVEDSDLDRMWEVNVKSPRRLIRAAWGALCEQGSGRVIVLASLSGKRVKSATSAPYAMTKHAAVALTHGVRQAGWLHGVRATAICPSFVNTDMARAISDVPPEEMTQPDDLARLVETVLDAPDTASMAELHVTCRLEEMF